MDDSGDRLVVDDAFVELFLTPTNVASFFKYPLKSMDQGAVVTYAQIEVTQTSDDVRCFIMSGGIGEREIILAVQATHTDLRCCSEIESCSFKQLLFLSTRYFSRRNLLFTRSELPSNVSGEIPVNRYEKLQFYDVFFN